MRRTGRLIAAAALTAVVVIITVLVVPGAPRPRRALGARPSRRAAALACAARPVACVGLAHRACGRHRVRPLLDGLELEVDVYGPRAPRCAETVTRLRRASARLSPRRVAVVDGWRCRRDVDAVSCARGTSVLLAQDPGE